VNLMTVAGIENNLYASSNQESAANVLPKPSEMTPDFWYPDTYDRTPMLRLGLPDVYGITPEEYDIMSIEITADNFDGVTVEVTDSSNTVVLDVSCICCIFLFVVNEAKGPC